MAKKAGGFGAGCLWLFVGLIVLSLAIYAIAIALFVALGVGLWFGIRYVWRRLVTEAPESAVVKAGMKLPPIGRKVAAGFVSAFVVFALIGAFAEPGDTEMQQNIGPGSSVEQSATPEIEDSDEPELGDLSVDFIDVGQGDAALIELPDGKTMLVDAGEASASQAVLDALDSVDIERIDYLVASHPHADHIGGMEAVLDAVEVGEVWAPDAPDSTETYAGFLDAVDDKGLEIEEAVAGEDIVDASSGYEVSVLGPGDGVDSDDMNDYSAIIRVEYGDTSFLFTGDASASDIVASDPGHIDVLKASHHGSETGTDAAVLDETSPDYVVMSYAEGNSYGHPNQSVLDAISAEGAKAYSTATNGMIKAVSDGEDVKVTTERDGQIAAGQTAEERAAAEAEAQQQVEAQAQADAEAQAQQQQQQQQQQEKTVVVTPSGTKYHNPGCRTLNRSKSLTEMTRSQAEAQGYEPCGVCHP